MSQNKKSRRSPGSRWFSFLLVALLFTALAGGFFSYILIKKAPVAPPLKPEKKSVHPMTRQNIPPPVLPQPTPLPAPGKAKLAIIIDDIGNNRVTAEKIMDLDMPLSFSVLPHSPFSKVLARRAEQQGRDVLLHLPMEPADKKWNPGPDTLFTDMSEQVILATLLDAIEATPMLIGINNHMGSKFTASKNSMTLFLRALQTVTTQRQQPTPLFFIDSLTSAESVGYQLAGEMGIKTARRNIFLDNDRAPAKISKQLRRLVATAKRNGQAIGIGHPHNETYEVLRDAQNFLQQEVQLVPIHQLVR